MPSQNQRFSGQKIDIRVNPYAMSGLAQKFCLKDCWKDFAPRLSRLRHPLHQIDARQNFAPRFDCRGDIYVHLFPDDFRCCPSGT